MYIILSKRSCWCWHCVPEKHGADEEKDGDLAGEVVGNVVDQAIELQVNFLEKVPRVECYVRLCPKYIKTRDMFYEPFFKNRFFEGWLPYHIFPVVE